MKISKAKLKTIIEEELEKILLSEAKSSKYPNLTQTSIETHTPRSMVSTVEVTPKGREELLNKREKFPAPKSPEMKRSIPAVKKLFPKLSSKDIKREIEESAGSSNIIGDILDLLAKRMFDQEQSLPPRPARGVKVAAAATPGTPANREFQGLTNPKKK